MGAGPSDLPLPSGPHTVGCCDVMTEGQPHVGDEAAGTKERPVFMRLYYPTEPCGDIRDRKCQWPLWIGRDEYIRGYAHTFSLRESVFAPMFRFFVGNLRVPVLWNAPLISAQSLSATQQSNRSESPDSSSDDPGFYRTIQTPRDLSTLPVLVFSHGLLANRLVYSAIAYDLASYGFMVAAVEHRDHSASISYYCHRDEEDSLREVWLDHQRIPIRHDDATFRKRNSQLHMRASECRAALHVLERINLGRPPVNCIDKAIGLDQFKDRLDLGRVAVAGHSFGGATTLQTLAEDTDFKVGIALDCWLFPLSPETLASIAQPVLLINATTFAILCPNNEEQAQKLLSNRQCTPGQEMAPIATPREKRIVTITNTGHMHQTDGGLLANSRMMRWWMQLSGKVDAETVHAVNTRLMLAWLCKHLDLSFTNESVDDVKSDESLKAGLVIDGVEQIANKHKYIREDPHTNDEHSVENTTSSL